MNSKKKRTPRTKKERAPGTPKKINDLSLELSGTTKYRYTHSRDGEHTQSTITYYIRRTDTYRNSSRHRVAAPGCFKKTRSSCAKKVPTPPRLLLTPPPRRFGDHMQRFLRKRGILRPPPLRRMWSSRRGGRAPTVRVLSSQQRSNRSQSPAHGTVRTSSHSCTYSGREKSNPAKSFNVEMEIGADLRRIAILNWAKRFPRRFQMRMERVCPHTVLLKKEH